MKMMKKLSIVMDDNVNDSLTAHDAVKQFYNQIMFKWIGSKNYGQLQSLQQAEYVGWYPR